MKYPTGLDNEKKRQEILEKVKRKEYIERCIKVNICPWCGNNLKDIEAQSSQHVTFACPSITCPGSEGIRKRPSGEISYYPDVFKK